MSLDSNPPRSVSYLTKIYWRICFSRKSWKQTKVTKAGGGVVVLITRLCGALETLRGLSDPWDPSLKKNSTTLLNWIEVLGVLDSVYGAAKSSTICRCMCCRLPKPAQLLLMKSSRYENTPSLKVTLPPLSRKQKLLYISGRIES